jgi:FHS family glucose/mannose:H+ symporter-like MFS transporter
VRNRAAQHSHVFAALPGVTAVSSSCNPGDKLTFYALPFKILAASRCVKSIMPLKSVAPASGARLLIIHVGFALTGVMTTLLGPLLPSLAAHWSLNDAHSGDLFLAQFIGSFLCAILCGHLIPLRGFRFCFVTAFSLIAVGTFLLGRGPWTLGLAAVFLYGSGLGLSISSTNLWIGEANPAGRAGALSLVNFTWTIGALASPSLVALGDHLHRMRLVFAGLSAVAALLALAFALSHFERSAPSNAETVGSTVLNLSFSNSLRDRFAPAFGLIFFLYVGTENCLSGWVATYAHRLQSLHSDAWALMPSCFWGGILVGRLSLPVILRGVSELRLLRMCLALGATGCGLLLVSTNIPEVAAGCAIAGLGLAGVFPIMMSWLSEYCGVANLQLAALVLAIGGLAGGVLPWLVGFISNLLGSLRIGLVTPLAAIILTLVVCAFPKSALPACVSKS